MWNHAPVMFGAMEAAGIQRPKLSPGDAADLFAYFYSTRFFDKPGDPARGKATFAEKHCGDCHGVNESRGENAPPIAKWESLADPVVMVQQMWNHSSHMQDAFARRKIAWQELTTQQLNDMQAWLRSLPETQHLPSRFSNTSDRDGYKIFEEKGCVNCHVGKLALEDRLHNMTLTDIAVDMWNHAPRMMKPTPSLTPGGDARTAQLSVDAAVRLSDRQRREGQGDLSGPPLRRLSCGRHARRAATTRTGAALLGSVDHLRDLGTRPADAESDEGSGNRLAAIQKSAGTRGSAGLYQLGPIVGQIDERSAPPEFSLKIQLHRALDDPRRSEGGDLAEGAAGDAHGRRRSSWRGSGR